MTLLLATVICLLVLEIFRAVDGSFGSLMNKRASWDQPPSVSPRAACLSRRLSGLEATLVCQRLIQHGMEEMNPLVRIGLGYPNELPLHCLDRILFHIGQDEEQLVGH